MKIYIDPGHGGIDSGAVGYGLLEKSLNLDISLRQKELFERLGHQVKMSRTTDKTVDLSVRTSEANKWGADVFISNHINAGGGVGVEVWHSINRGKSKEYAERVEKNLSKMFKSRGIKSREGRNGDYLYVIRTAAMPAILTEIGFIDSVEDTVKLKNGDIRQKCAEAVVEGILGQRLSDETNSSTKQPEQSNYTNRRTLVYKIPMLKGEDVKFVQHKLNQLGLRSGMEDGIYGPDTREAVRRYQRIKRLYVDGIVGKNTWQSLMS
ncbi:N-acetylmuramoyl-L-alanine amidase [Clostridium sp. JNZ J1-5]